MNTMNCCPNCSSKNSVILLLAVTLALTAVKLNQHTGFLDRAWERFKRLSVQAVESIERQADTIGREAKTAEGKGRP